MRKLFLRIIALSLIAALVADPMTASAALTSRSFCDAQQAQTHQGLFSRQALAETPLSRPILKHVPAPSRLLNPPASPEGFVFQSGQPPGDDSLVLIGDLDGRDDILRSLAHDAGYTSETGAWSAGKATLIQMGDLAARSPRSLEVWKASGKLQKNARAAGGDYIRLLGNHEWKLMIGKPEQMDIDGMEKEQTRKLGTLLRQDAAKGRAQVAFAVGEFLITHAGIPYLLWEDIKTKMIARNMKPSDPQDVAEYLNSIARAAALPDMKKTAKDWSLIDEGFRFVNATVGVDHYAHPGALTISKYRPQVTAHDPVEDIGPVERDSDGWIISVDVGNDEENPKRLGYLTMDRFGTNVRSVLLHKDGRRVIKELRENERDPHFSFELVEPPPPSSRPPHKMIVFAIAQKNALLSWLRAPFQPNAGPLVRLGTQLLYTIPIVGLTWGTSSWLKLHFPGHWPYAVLFANFLVGRTGLAYLAEGIRNTAPEDSHASSQPALTRRFMLSVAALSATISIVTLHWPFWAAAALSSAWFNQHALWAGVITVFIMSVAIRSAYVLHQTRFWGEWPAASIRRLNQTLYMATVLLGNIGLSAGIAHYALRDDSFYTVRCFWRNSVIAIALAIWGSQWLLSVQKRLSSFWRKVWNKYAQKILRAGTWWRIGSTWSLFVLGYLNYEHTTRVRRLSFVADLMLQVAILIPFLIVRRRHIRGLQKNDLINPVAEAA